MRLVSIQRLLRRGAITNLAKMLARMHPADIANVIDHLSSLKEKREIFELVRGDVKRGQVLSELDGESITLVSVSYTHLRAHETVLDLVCRLLLEKKKNKLHHTQSQQST